MFNIISIFLSLSSDKKNPKDISPYMANMPGLSGIYKLIGIHLDIPIVNCHNKIPIALQKCLIFVRDSWASGVKMNRVLFAVPVFLFLLGCSIFPNVTPAQNPSTPVQTTGGTPEPKVIRLTNGEWVPYTGKDLPDYGCDSKIVSTVFSHLGYKVEYGFFPWARGFRLAETGEWDGMIEWADTVEARKSFYVSKEAISHQEFVFFRRVDHPFEWKSIDDLEGKVIGLTSGYLYSDLFNKVRNDSRYQFQEASTDEANFEKLLASRIDIFPIERNVGLAILKTKFTTSEADQLTYDNKPLSTFEPYVFLTRKNVENENLMKQYNLAFKEFLYSDEYQKIASLCKE